MAVPPTPLLAKLLTEKPIAVQDLSGDCKVRFRVNA
jgi:hypothetical protein